MSDILSPNHPQHVADLFRTDAIKWETGWGDHKTHTCLHGGLLTPCSIAGDEIMWSILMSARGATTAWNDDQETVTPIIERLVEQHDPDVAEMVAVFGPNWEPARNICRTWATATDAQRQDTRDPRNAEDARAAWAAWDARAARAAWAAWDPRAARGAWAAWAAWDARAAWAAWAARCARAARAAFVATIARPWIGTLPEWTQEAHDRLIAPWVSVFGPIEQEYPL